MARDFLSIFLGISIGSMEEVYDIKNPSGLSQMGF
jgi:hypothetical protein